MARKALLDRPPTKGVISSAIDGQACDKQTKPQLLEQSRVSAKRRHFRISLPARLARLFAGALRPLARRRPSSALPRLASGSRRGRVRQGTFRPVHHRIEQSREIRIRVPYFRAIPKWAFLSTEKISHSFLAIELLIEQFKFHFRRQC